MHLKKVELAGFKSFADRTEFVFDGGVTAVIGPNGCGKSNLVDAVRWVLGEQSAKSLRAGNMGDCIFAGTATRKALGYAEATLIFDNASGALPIEYDEVGVTRRVYGSGEGEYFINKKPCRLKDIRELFMGTGVGTTAYSVIEQGEISRIISTDPKELRDVFDEAAGIRLYKARLRTTAAKLERVTHNLLRVGDILAEVEKRLRSVKYQATKARRFREHSVRLREIKLLRARLEFSRLSVRRDELSSVIDDARERLETLQKSVFALESQSEASRSRAIQIEEEIERSSEELSRVDKDVNDLNFAIELSRERITNSEKNEARLKQLVEKRRLQLEAAEEHIATLELRRRTVEERTGKLSRLAAAQTDTERELAELDRTLAGEISSSEAEVVEALRKTASLNNRIGEIAAGERGAGQQRDRLFARRSELVSSCRELDQKRIALGLAKARLESERTRLNREAESLVARKAACSEAKDALETALSEARNKLASATSRRELLEDLQRRREGVSDAALAVLDMNLEGTLGLVADILSVPAEIAAQVEDLLGEDQAAVVVESTAVALEARDRLSRSGLGRAKLISLERAATVRHAAGSHIEFLTPLAPSVACRPGCDAVVEALLGDCRLAQSLEAVLSANGRASALRIATAQGDIIDSDGGISSGRAGSTGGLIWRKAEIEKLSAAAGEMQSEVETLASRRRELVETTEILASREADAARRLSRNAASEAEIKASGDALDSRLGETRREATVVDSEVASLAEEIAAFSQERDAVKSEIDAARLESATLEDKIERVRQARKETQARLDEARARYTRLKITLASALEKQSGLKRRYDQAASGLGEHAAALAAAIEEIDAAGKIVARENVRISEARVSLEESVKQANAARVVLAARQREGRELRDEASRLAPALKSGRESLETVRQETSDLSIEEREVSVRLSDLVSRARDELSISPQELSEPAGEVEDREALDAEIADLTKKLSSMGGVNMEALEELDELEQRHIFLTNQRDDLASARDSLEKIIAKTRAASRKMFLESFESVRENFSLIFRRIFGGGRADCVLVDPDDPLESPIQIFAKPPGKELSNLNLLSGGEKAMTAVALLFAMFSTRPSPFLILDEVDAPMDESNIGRFIDLMRDFLPTSKFIVITHSRKTMAAADTIYGITMEEQGVSRKVSMSFREEAATLEPVTA